MGPQLGGVLGRAVVLRFGIRVPAAAGEVGSSAVSSVVRSSTLSGWGSAFTSLLERAELWVRDSFLCTTQNLDWMSCLGLPYWRPSK